VFRRFVPVRGFPVRVLWWESLLHVLVFAAVAGLVIFLIVRLTHDHRHHGHPVAWSHTTPAMSPPAPPPVDPALNEARLRYARGELTRDDFLRVVTDLTGQPPPTA
jgi:putative membrane protein